jgi:transposase-like protein
MRARELKRMRAMVKRLNGRQRKVLAADLAAMEFAPAAAEVIERRADGAGHCPHCAGRRIVRNGNSGGLQRYLCRSCRRTFNALTGTPLARLHLRGKWLGQAAALRDGLSLTQAGERLGIARTTAFRWRHRFLALPKELRAQLLTGVAEADETYFLRSSKGQRHGLGRKARRRGGKAQQRGLSKELVPVLVACDRAGKAADFILQADDSDHVVAKLKPILPKDAILCTEGNSVMMASGRKLEVEHHAVNVRAGIRVDGPWHVQNVNGYHSRLKQWMGRFKGAGQSHECFSPAPLAPLAGRGSGGEGKSRQGSWKNTPSPQPSPPTSWWRGSRVVASRHSCDCPVQGRGHQVSRFLPGLVQSHRPVSGRRLETRVLPRYGNRQLNPSI